MANRKRSQSQRGRRGATEQAPPVDFSVEYHYVLADLKRLALIAVGLSVLLVVLALVV